MTTYVMDACALLASLRGETGGDVVDNLLADPASDCLVHAVNLCEVFYEGLRNTDLPTAEQTIEDSLAFGLILRTDLEPAFWQQVGQLKVNPGKLSLADCFALALAMTTGATLVTSDHHEFDSVAALGLCPILFIR